MENKKYHVLWTGGLDSTALVCSLLEQGYEVKVSYVEIRNNENQYKRELNAMKEIQEKLFTINDFNLKSTVNDDNTRAEIFFEDEVYITFKMLPTFIMHMLYSYHPDYTFALAYVANDDFIPYTEDFKTALNSFIPFFRYNFDGIPNETIDQFDVEFPLIKTTKIELYDYLKKFGQKYFEDDYAILKHITYCDVGKEEDYCGECDCCKRVINDVPELFEIHSQKVTHIDDIKEKEMELSNVN